MRTAESVLVGVVLIAQVVGGVNGVSGEPALLVVAVGSRGIGAVNSGPYMAGVGNCELAVPVLVTGRNTQGACTGSDEVSHVTAVTGLVLPGVDRTLLGIIVVVVGNVGTNILHEVEHSLVGGSGLLEAAVRAVAVHHAGLSDGNDGRVGGLAVAGGNTG